MLPCSEAVQHMVPEHTGAGGPRPGFPSPHLSEGVITVPAHLTVWAVHGVSPYLRTALSSAGHTVC